MPARRSRGCRSRRWKRERLRAGSAGMGGSRPPPPRRPTGRTKRWPTGRGAPDRPDGSRCRWYGRRYRTARHGPRFAPSAHDHIPQSRAACARSQSLPLLDQTPFWGWSPVLASNSGSVPLHLIASAQDGDPPATRRFRHLTSADLRESEIAAAPKHRSPRRDARMHPLRVRGLRLCCSRIPAASAVILTLWRARCRRVASHLCQHVRYWREPRLALRHQGA